MHSITLVDAPSILGLKPSGVELLPEALRRAGVLERLGARDSGRVPTIGYTSRRDRQTGLMNPNGLREFSLLLADHLGPIFDEGRFPLVLGGDCSILIGCLLALKRRGTPGLLFLDGHADFYQPEASPTGEAADMDLAIVSGRGPDIVADIEHQCPLVRDEHIIAFGCRDLDAAQADGSQDIRETEIQLYALDKVRELGAEQAVTFGIQRMTHNGAAGFWIHLDVDVLEDELMPAVDYRMIGGLAWDELIGTLRIALESGSALGMSIAIFNPTLDPSGEAAQALVRALEAAFGNTQLPLAL